MSTKEVMGIKDAYSMNNQCLVNHDLECPNIREKYKERLRE